MSKTCPKCGREHKTVDGQLVHHRILVGGKTKRCKGSELAPARPEKKFEF